MSVFVSDEGRTDRNVDPDNLIVFGIMCTYTEHLMSVIRGNFVFEASSSI